MGVAGRGTPVEGEANVRGRQWAGWAAAAVPPLVSACVLAGGSSAWGRAAVAVGVAVLAAVAAALVAARALPFRVPYVWLGLLAALLVVSFAAPAVPGAASEAAQGTPGTAPGTTPGTAGTTAGTTAAVGVVSGRLAAVVAALGGPGPERLAGLADLGGLLAGLALTAACVAWAPCPRLLTRVIALTGGAAAGLALATGEYAGGRLEALGCNPNYLGLVLAFPVVAAAGLVRYTRSAVWLLPAAVCLVALIDTQSRSATLTVLVGVAAVLVQDRPVRVQALLAGAALGVAAAAVYAGGVPPIGTLGSGDRAAADLSDGNALRVRVAAFAVQVIAEHPLRGVGYLSFPAMAERSPLVGVYLTTHNEYLRLAAEAGVAAAAALLALIWLGARHGRSGELAVLRAIVLGCAAAGLSFANPLGSLVVSAPFWAALGCLLAHRPGAAPGASPVRLPGRLGRLRVPRPPVLFRETYARPGQRAAQQAEFGGARQQFGEAEAGGAQEPAHLQSGEKQLARAGGRGATRYAEPGDERRAQPRAKRQGRHRRR